MLIMTTSTGLLLMGVTSEDVIRLAEGATLVAKDMPEAPPTTDLVVVYGASRSDVVERLRSGGLPLDEDILNGYIAGTLAPTGPLLHVDDV